MRDRRVVAVAFVVSALLVYGALFGLQGFLSEDSAFTSEDELVVQGTTIHLDRVGRPTVVGEVYNPLGEPVSNATVTVTFLRDGAVVGEASGPVLRPVLPTGERAPFDIHLGSETPVDTYEVSVSFDRGGSVVEGLAVAETRLVMLAQDQVIVTAVVENTADSTIGVERAVATFYGENGSVVGARVDHPSPAHLAPGESAEVEFTFRTLGDVPSLAQEYTRFEVIAHAEETAE